MSANEWMKELNAMALAKSNADAKKKLRADYVR
jgi:hypothetical protein